MNRGHKVADYVFAVQTQYLNCSEHHESSSYVFRVLFMNQKSGLNSESTAGITLHYRIYKI